MGWSGTGGLWQTPQSQAGDEARPHRKRASAVWLILLFGAQLRTARYVLGAGEQDKAPVLTDASGGKRQVGCGAPGQAEGFSEMKVPLILCQGAEPQAVSELLPLSPPDPPGRAKPLHLPIRTSLCLGESPFLALGGPSGQGT